MNRTGKFEELQRFTKEIQQSEGERIGQAILNMQASLRLVDRNYQELVRPIKALQQEKATLMLHDITKGEELNEAFEIIITRLRNFLAAYYLGGMGGRAKQGQNLAGCQMGWQYCLL